MFRQKKETPLCARKKEPPYTSTKIPASARIHHTKCISKSPSPSLAGQTVIADKAVLLAPDHCSSAPSQSFRSSDISMQIRSLLQWRDRAGIYQLPY